MSVDSGIEVYRVGFFKDLEMLKRRIKTRSVGSWRAFFWQVRRLGKKPSYWRGYEAQWHFPPAGMKIWKVGKGWTKKRALRRLAKHVVKSNLITNGNVLHT